MNKHTNKALIATGGLATVTLLSGYILFSSLTYADSSSDASVTIPVACTMNGSGMNSHSDSIVNGTYKANIGTTTMNIVCNDNNGFSIYAAGFTGGIPGEEDSNKLVGTSASNYSKIATGTATTAGNPDVSNWAMKLSTNAQATYPIDIATGYEDYHAVPNVYTKVATRASGTDAGTGATGASFTTTYAAYISKTQLADTYSGKVKYVLIHPNDGEAPTTPPAPLSTCNTKVPGITYMQELNNSNTATVMANMNDGTQYYLRDRRDDEPYCVAKIQGAIWMTQNLRINGVIPAEGSNFTGEDINIAQCDLDANVGDCSVSRSNYTIPMTHDSGNTTNGVWYNFAAASALTITGNNNTSEVTQDICPDNWRMPDYNEDGSAGSVNSLVGTDYTSAFSPVAGGHYDYYYVGQIVNANIGYWWSNGAGNNTHRFGLSSNSSTLSAGWGYGDRRNGLSVRCVRVPE